MGKAEDIAAAKAVLLSAQDAALDQFGGACYDAGAASVPASGGSGISPEQEAADIAAAVSAAIAPLNDQIAALQLAKGQEDALLASVKKSFQDFLAQIP